MPSILLIITGSIAAKKAVDLCKILKNNNYHIDIILTKSAQEFVTAKDFSKLKIKNIFTDIFDAKMEQQIGHIALSRKNDIVLIYPASANFIAKLAHGIADDLASTAVLASNKKILLAPAMNVEMWHNKVVQDNIVTLEQRDLDIIYPESGKLACGEVGMGRLKEVDDIYNIIVGYFNYRAKLANKNIIVTAGGTIEKIDSVRYIGNFSSGKQGIEIAKKFYQYGANVTLVAAQVTCHIPQNMKVLKCKSALEMSEILEAELSKLEYDIGIFSAAIADFRVAKIAEHKIKKNQIDELNLRLIKNPDILANISKKSYRPKILVGFAAESEKLEFYAKEKLIKKNCDYIIANNIVANNVFASNHNNILLVSKNKILKKQASKEKIADFIVKNII